MASMAFVAPTLPGGTEKLRLLVQEIQGARTLRHKDTKNANRRDRGERREFLMSNRRPNRKRCQFDIVYKLQYLVGTDSFFSCTSLRPLRALRLNLRANI